MRLNKYKKYFVFLKVGILDGFVYKFSVFGWLLGDLVFIIIFFYLW